MVLGDLVRKLAGTLSPQKEAVSIGIGCVASAPLLYLAYEIAPPRSSVEIMQQIGLSTSPLWSYGIVHSLISALEFFLPGEKRDSTEVMDIIEQEETPTRKRSLLAPASLATGAITLASTTTTRMSSYTQWTWENDNGLLGKIVEQEIPLSVLVGTAAFCALGNVSRKPIEKRIGEFSILATGLFYYSVAQGDPSMNFGAALVSPGIALMAYCALACLVRPPSRKETVNALTFSFRSDEKKKEMLGKESDITYLLDDLQESNFDDLFMKCGRLIEHPLENVHPIVRLARSMQIKYSQTEARMQGFLSPRNPQYDITRAALEFVDNNHTGAQQFLARAIRKAERFEHPLRNDTYVLYGMLTEKWQSCIEHILEDSSLTFEPLAESANEVLRIGSSRFLGGIFAIKRGKHTDLLEEKTEAEETAQRITHPERKTADQLYISPPPTASPLLVTRYAHGYTLDQSTDIHDYHDVAGYLGEIHTKIKSKKGKRNYKLPLTKRFSHELFGDCRGDLFAHWDCLWERINGVHYFDKDPQGKNWIITDGGVVALDFPDKGETDQCIQLAKLTEHSSFFGGDIDARVQAYRAYRRECASINMKQLVQGVLAATPLVAMNAFYYSSQGRADHRMTQNYLRNASWALDLGKNEFGWSDPSFRVISRIVRALAETSAPS